MIALIDYGVGNIFSVSASLKAIGAEFEFTSDKQKIEQADRIILPGVGAFEDAAKLLFDSGMADLVCEQARKGKPILGICLGMQLLFEKSYEYGEHKGLGLIKGDICPLEEDISLTVPHMGWNKLDFVKSSPLLKYIKEGDYVYYVHSYYAKNCDEALVATSNYGVDVAGVVANGNVFGTQFHPEKSGDVGLAILKGFTEV